MKIKKEKHLAKDELRAKIIEINYAEPLKFLRDNKNQFPETSALIAFLETLQGMSHYYKVSESSDKEEVFFNRICQYKLIDSRRAIEELKPLVNYIPLGKEIEIALELITDNICL